MGKVSYTYILFYFLTGLGPLFHQLAQGKEHFVTHSTPQPQEVTFACPTGLTPLFTDEQVCSGDFINVPPDDVILDNVDVNESAFVQWDMDVTAPVFNNSPNCEIIEIQYNYFILCTEQPSFILEGGSHFVTVFPDLHPPVIEVDADCNFNIIPHCPDDVVNPPVVNPDLSEQDFAVVNPLGCSVIFTIPIPDCFLPIEVFDLIVIPNCNEYFVEFSIAGGTGNYLINGSPLPPGQSTFSSDAIPCETPFNFDVTDDMGTDVVPIFGEGTACLPPLTTTAPSININGLQYEVSFTILGGTGNYMVDGQPLTGATFTSQPIACGQPFSFLVDDGCEVLTVSGGPVVCYDPITASPAEIIQNCNEYQVSFMIEGGTGNYVINGIPLPPGQNSFLSDLLPCGTAFNFQITDDLSTDLITVSGNGTACLPPLITSDALINTIGGQYEVSFNISGGTGIYTVNGIPIPGDTFTSNLIDCGLPFSFLVSDNCETSAVESGPVQCFEPITVTEPVIIQNCNQYQVSITISGGTGNYVVNGTPLPPGQNTATSQFVPCGTNFFIQVTDDQATDVVDINGSGPACLPPLFTSDPIIEVVGLQYQVTFGIQGGTGDYTVNGQPVAGNTFTSGLIPCGLPYSFEVSDGCQTLFISELLVQCYPPITAEVQINTECNTFQVTLFLGGGTGNYVINGISLAPGQVEFVSNTFDCEAGYIFQITDDLGSDEIQIADIGPACFEELAVSPPTTEIQGNQYRISFTLSNGTGNYFVDGQSLDGNIFTSDLIDCGTPYSFVVSDLCNEVPVAGEGPQCLDPVAVSEIETESICNQYTAQFNVSGGSGEYAINDIPIPSDLFISDFLACETPYDFVVADLQTGETININGTGPDCNTPLTISPVETGQIGNQYTAQFTASGGTGTYEVNGIPLPGDVFISDPIDCGQPYSFQLSDGCELIPIDGGPIDCLPPLMASDVFIGPICNQFTAQFTISGGSGEYAVDGIAVPGDLFTSDLIDCVDFYDFELTDQQTGESIDVSGMGSACNDPLVATLIEIEIIDGEYFVRAFLSGGTGEYVADGIPFSGDIFVSDPIDCGQPYDFILGDGCETIPVEGGPIDCFPPLMTSDIFIGPICNEFTAQFTVNGGSGDYAVNDIPLPGDLFISDLLECETPYDFVVSDLESGETINLNGTGPDCNDPLMTSSVELGALGNQYTAQFTVSGGSGEYEVDGFVLPGNHFISDLIDCGEPYIFGVSDGCESIELAGDGVNCPPAIFTSDVFVGPQCNQYTVQFTVGGGSGEYAVDGIPIPGDHYVSDYMECETPFSFEVSDEETGESVNVNGAGPDCSDPLTASLLDIEIIENQFIVSISITGGSGEYEVNGIPIPGDLFVSDPIDCGLPYSFEVADGCEVVPVEGGPVNCLPPLTTSEPFVGPVCNQFTAQFSIGGGSGEYLVDGIPLPGDLFISDLLDCEAPFDFNVTDQQTGESVDVSGNGPECNDPLTTSPVEIGVIGDQYTAQFTTSGGSGDYEVNGIPLPGNLFISDPIDCGLPYSFEVADGCEVVPVEGGPVNCLPPLTTSEPFIGPICNQFTAQFSISGGSGEYLVDGIPLPGDLFISDLLDCGTPFSFEVTDQQNSDPVTVAGEGPICPDPLTTSPVETAVDGTQYTAQFNITGGSGEYVVNDIPLSSNLFISDLIECGEPYAFTLDDGCETLTISGPSPCQPCPEMINDFTTQLEQCQGELPMLPSDDDILTNIDVPEHAIIEWSGDPNVPLEHPGSCEPSLQSFALSIKCATDTSVNLDGGIITILVYPEPTAPTVVLTDSTEMTCFYEVIPACDHDTVEPSTIQAPNGTIGSTIDIVVANPGCSQGITYTVSIPDCMLVGLEDQGVNPFDLSIHRNPFGEGEKLGIQFTIANRQEMRLTVYDLNGRTVKTLRRQSFTEGTHYIEWDGRATNGRMVPAGMYLIELHTPENRHIAKVVKYE